MINNIVIKDLEIECIIGIHEWERNTPQTIYVDIKGYFDFSPVIQSHSFKDTIDYVGVSRLVTEVAKKGRYKLLEAMADEISQALFAKFPLTSVSLEFKKPTPDVSQAKYVGISYKINKNQTVLSRSYALEDRHYTRAASARGEQPQNIFANKVSLITGSAKGLGRALAEHLGRLGCRVAIHYRTHKQEALDFAGELEKKKIRANVFQGDLRDYQSMKHLAQEVVRECGQIDFLVNNVGAYSPKNLWEYEPEEFARIIETNICGTYYLTREVLPYMRQKNFGRIINIGQASSEQVRAHKNETPYYISKTGILMLTKSIAAVEAKNGITCNMISPGIMINNTYFPTGIFDSIPMGRLGKFEDFFGAVEFLLSPAGDYVTGTSIDVSGGYGL